MHGEVVHRLAHAHVEHFGDVLALERHPQGGVVEAFAVAHLAGHVHVGEEVHLHDLEAVAFAGLAPSALDVERESTRLVAVGARFRRPREHVADAVEHLGVRGRIAPGRAADGLLVDLDDLVEMLDAAQRLVGARRLA